VASTVGGLLAFEESARHEPEPHGEWKKPPRRKATCPAPDRDQSPVPTRWASKSVVAGAQPARSATKRQRSSLKSKSMRQTSSQTRTMTCAPSADHRSYAPLAPNGVATIPPRKK
jgi:hypothetical protein